MPIKDNIKLVMNDQSYTAFDFLDMDQFIFT